jgi:hypothetical protein
VLTSNWLYITLPFLVQKFVARAITVTSVSLKACNEDIDVLVACHGNHFLLLQGPRRRERNQFILQFSFSMNASPPRLMIDGATGSMLSRCSAG